MLSALQQLASTGPRFDRTQVVLEILSHETSLSIPATLRIAASADPTVTIAQRLPPEQGSGYLVTYQGRTLPLPLRGNYTAGQIVRLTFLPAPQATATIPMASMAPITLGTDARLIGSILSRGAQLPTGAPLQLPSVNSVTGVAAISPAADALKQALTESGVFYESHLAEWAQGDRTLEALKREPQGRITPAIDSALLAGSLKTAGTPDALIPVVKEQLQALDARQIGWRGEIWPRQTIELTIAEQDSGEREEGTPAAWTTSMKLELPQLGGVQAVLQMQGDALRIGLRASEESAPTLKDNGRELAASFATLGLKLVSMRVEEHDAQAL